MVLERDVEQALTRYVEKAGGLCVKFDPSAVRGMPDRVVMLPGGVVVWVELKKPKGGKLSVVQRHRHRVLRELGQVVEVCWTKEDAARIVAAYKVNESERA